MPVRLLEMNKVGKSENSSCNPVYQSCAKITQGPELGSEKSATLGRKYGHKPVSVGLTLRTLVAAVGLEPTTYGLREHRTNLKRYENFLLYLNRQPLTSPSVLSEVDPF